MVSLLCTPNQTVGLGMPGLVRDWGRIKGKPTQYLYNNHTIYKEQLEREDRFVVRVVGGFQVHQGDAPIVETSAEGVAGGRCARGSRGGVGTVATRPGRPEPGPRSPVLRSLNTHALPPLRPTMLKQQRLKLSENLSVFGNAFPRSKSPTPIDVWAPRNKVASVSDLSSRREEVLSVTVKGGCDGAKVASASNGPGCARRTPVTSRRYGGERPHPREGGRA